MDMEKDRIRFQSKSISDQKKTLTDQQQQIQKQEKELLDWIEQQQEQNKRLRDRRTQVNATRALVPMRYTPSLPNLEGMESNNPLPPRRLELGQRARINPIAPTTPPANPPQIKQYSTGSDVL